MVIILCFFIRIVFVFLIFLVIIFVSFLVLVGLKGVIGILLRYILVFGVSIGSFLVSSVEVIIEYGGCRWVMVLMLGFFW